MTARYPYDPGFDPPAPVLPVRIGPPGAEVEGVLLRVLVDTGADLTVVPEDVAVGAGLPPIGEVEVRGVGGEVRRATLYAAEVEVADASEVVETVGLGEEALLGRNLLNAFVLTLRGPDGVLEVGR